MAPRRQRRPGVFSSPPTLLTTVALALLSLLCASGVTRGRGEALSDDDDTNDDDGCYCDGWLSTNSRSMQFGWMLSGRV